MRVMRVRLLVVVAIASVAAAAPAVAADRVVERGIVQSVAPDGVVLRALDGTEITVPLVAETRYQVNGRPATIAEIRPGFVAEVVTSGSGAAIVVRAFGLVERPVERGVIARLAPRGLVLRRGQGDTIRIPINDRTVVWRGGLRVRLRTLRRGMAVDVALTANGAARVILIRRASR
jgi:hypothetical protein